MRLSPHREMSVNTVYKSYAQSADFCRHNITTPTQSQQNLWLTRTSADAYRGKRSGRKNAQFTTRRAVVIFP
jgi:hypothetical protein